MPGREEVPGRDRVAAIGLRVDAQDLAAQIVRVGRRPLGVPRRAARALVDRIESPRLERLGVVAGREIEIAVRTELERARVVGGLLALHPDP